MDCHGQRVPFPLSVFCQLHYGELAAYEDVEWIVTDKGFLQAGRERARLRAELSDLQRLLGHSVIVINTYRHFEQDAIAGSLCRQGTELVMKVLSYLQDVQLSTGKESLQWYLNPSAEEITRILLDGRTAYFFADFHTAFQNDRLQWQLGEGQRQSWKKDGISPAPPGPQYFSWKDRHDNLSHIRLMRVFHCHAIFDAYEGMDPAGDHSIVRSLLNAGVQRVEGGMTQEEYLDYLCSLLHLFGRAQGLGFVLQFKCLERGEDFRRLMERINAFLAACHWDSIPV